MTISTKVKVEGDDLSDGRKRPTLATIVKFPPYPFTASSAR